SPARSRSASSGAEERSEFSKTPHRSLQRLRPDFFEEIGALQHRGTRLYRPAQAVWKGVAMDHFLYQGGILHAEDVAIPDIAAAVGTPFYVYSTATLTRHYQLFTEALAPLPHLVCFAIKSLSNVAVLKVLGDLGAGMDVVSIGEYLRARAAGVPGERIVFSGVGKTRAEIRAALEEIGRAHV